MPKRAIVTGGASGIGRATVVRLLDEGWQVVALDLAENVAARGGHAVAAGVLTTSWVVAEYFRDDENRDVLLFIDNIFRFT